MTANSSCPQCRVPKNPVLTAQPLCSPLQITHYFHSLPRFSWKHLGQHWAVFYPSSPCRYNNYDRAVFNTVPHDVVRRWYRAHRALTAELRRPDNELWVKLKPGKVGTCSCILWDWSRVGFAAEFPVGLAQGGQWMWQCLGIGVSGGFPRSGRSRVSSSGFCVCVFLLS